MSKYGLREVLFLLIGLLAMALVVATQDPQALLHAWSQIGWRIGWLSLLFLAGLVFGTYSWAQLFRPQERPTFGLLYLANWTAYSANQLLPVARIGGDVLKARLVERPTTAATTSIASAVADKTVQAATLIPYALVGCLALLTRQTTSGFLLPVVATLTLLGAGIFVFYRLQTESLIPKATRILGRFLPLARRDGVEASAESVKQALAWSYQDRRRFRLALAAATVFRVVVGIEVWLTLSWLGHPVTLVDAIMLESLNQIVRAATFILPGAFGAQEGGLLLLGTALGIPAPAALTISLAKRARELLVGIPAFFWWQLLETRRDKARAR